MYRPARARICKPFKEPGIDSQPGGPVRQPYLLYRLARLHRLAESIPRNRFLGFLKRLQIRAQTTLASEIGSLESIPRIHNMKMNMNMKAKALKKIKNWELCKKKLIWIASMFTCLALKRFLEF